MLLHQFKTVHVPVPCEEQHSQCSKPVCPDRRLNHGTFAAGGAQLTHTCQAVRLLAPHPADNTSGPEVDGEEHPRHEFQSNPDRPVSQFFPLAFGRTAPSPLARVWPVPFPSCKSSLSAKTVSAERRWREHLLNATRPIWMFLTRVSTRRGSK